MSTPRSPRSEITCQQPHPEPGSPERPFGRPIATQALHAPVEFVTVPSFSGYASPGNTSACSRTVSVSRLSTAITVCAVPSAFSTARGRGSSGRVGVVQPDGRQLAVGEPRRCRGRRPARPGGEAGAVAGSEARLAQPARVRHRRDLEQPRARRQPQPAGEVEQRPRARRGQRALAVDDHQVVAGVAQPGREVAHRLRVRAGGGRRAGEVALVARQGGLERHQQPVAAARRDPLHDPRLRVERGRPR